MKNIYNVASDMETIFPKYTFRPIYETNTQETYTYMVFVDAKKNTNKCMKLEMILDNGEDSVVTSLLDQRGFRRSEYTEILDLFMKRFN